jgi:hypothetical protein
MDLSVQYIIYKNWAPLLKQKILTRDFPATSLQFSYEISFTELSPH